jgi:hypothetical protein
MTYMIDKHHREKERGEQEGRNQRHENSQMVLDLVDIVRSLAFTLKAMGSHRHISDKI